MKLFSNILSLFIAFFAFGESAFAEVSESYKPTNGCYYGHIAGDTFSKNESSIKQFSLEVNTRTSEESAFEQPDTITYYNGSDVNSLNGIILLCDYTTQLHGLRLAIYSDYAFNKFLKKEILYPFHSFW